MVEKLKNGYFKVKSYWKKPPRGYEVCYKELLYFAVGSGGISFLSVMVGIAGITVNADIMVGFFDVSQGLAFLLSTVLGSIIALIRAPILSMIIDNSNGKMGKGKFKPLLMWSAIAAAICFIFVPFIPQGWVDTILFSANIPAIPLFKITAQSVNFSIGIIVLFALVQIGTFFFTLLSQCMVGIEQTISTVAQERANIISIKSILANLPGSVLNALIPIIAGLFFATTGHMQNINLYKIIFPIAAIGGLILLTFMLKTKERVVVNKEYKAKVKFTQGIKDLSKNKYFWLITIFNAFIAIRNNVNIVNWIRQFSYAGQPFAQSIVGLFNTTLLMSILIVGMATAPMLIKLMGKKKLMLYSSIGCLVMIGFQMLVYKNPILVLVASFFQNIFTGFAFVSTIMVTDVLDYQQWKTGRRVEGFWQNYTGFIATILGILIGLVVTVFLSFAGVGFADEIKDVLIYPEIRDKAYFYMTLLGLIGGVLCIIPMFFYDLDEKKHKNYVRALKIRAVTENYANGELSDGDVVALNQIVSDAHEIENMFVLAELSKHDCIEAILSGIDGARVRVAEAARIEAIGDLQRELELENNRIYAKAAREKTKIEKANAKAEIQNAKAKENKKGGKQVEEIISFNENDYIAAQKKKSHYFKYFEDIELSSYTTIDSIFADIEKVYDIYSGKVAVDTRANNIANFKKKLLKANNTILEKLEKARANASKKNQTFDETTTRASIQSKTKCLKYFASGELAQYRTIDEIYENIEQVYDMYKDAERIRNL